MLVNRYLLVVLFQWLVHMDYMVCTVICRSYFNGQCLLTECHTLAFLFHLALTIGFMDNVTFYVSLPVNEVYTCNGVRFYEPIFKCPFTLYKSQEMPLMLKQELHCGMLVLITYTELDTELVHF